MKNKPLLGSVLLAIVLIVGTVSMYPTPGMGRAYAAIRAPKSPLTLRLHLLVQDAKMLKTYT